MSRRNGTARVGRPSTGPGMVQDLGTGAGGEVEPAGTQAQRARWRARWAAVAAVVAALVWLAVDLFGPRSTSLRSFDPIEVARLESAMWRSYYDNDRLRLFNQLAELMRMQFRLPFVRSHVVAYHAARAAFTFKNGRGREDYEKALPNLVSYYSAIRQVGDVPFDVNRAARLELEWWIIHRERTRYPAGALDRALAELAAEVYAAPADSLMDHGRLRAEAMTVRDTQAEAGGVTETNWTQIEHLLRASWQSLWEVLNA